MEAFGEGQYGSMEHFNETHPHFSQVKNELGNIDFRLEISLLTWIPANYIRKNTVSKLTIYNGLT